MKNESLKKQSETIQVRPCHPRQQVRTKIATFKRILLVSSSLPFPPEKGSNQRTYLLWKALSEIAPVDVILCDDLVHRTVPDPAMPASFNFLGSFPWQSKGNWFYRLSRQSTPHPAIERFLRVLLPRDWDYRIDAGLSRRISDVLPLRDYFLAVGRYLKPIVKTGIVGRIPSLLDVDDVDFDIFAQRAQEEARPVWERRLYSMQSSQIKTAFKKWLPKFETVWVTKAGDKQYEVTRNAAILPNIPFNLPPKTSLESHSPSTRPVLLTVAFLSYLPNRDGVDRFIREAWPKVRAACPTAEYWLVGRNDPATANRWKAVPGVRVLGYVDDLTPFYNASWFTLCPLWTGAGTNIKVLESLAFGRTCVATVLGHRGYEDRLVAGDSVLIGADPDELAKSCIRLINDHAQRLALAKRGQEVVRREFSYEKFARIVHQGVERALSQY
jgi:glycosyltransferase involved in cell wall biosynthesis